MPGDDLALRGDLPRRAIALALAGGRGSRFHQPSDRRVKPAVCVGRRFGIFGKVIIPCAMRQRCACGPPYALSFVGFSHKDSGVTLVPGPMPARLPGA
jgi:hypothetical protein